MSTTTSTNGQGQGRGGRGRGRGRGRGHSPGRGRGRGSTAGRNDQWHASRDLKRDAAQRNTQVEALQVVKRSVTKSRKRLLSSEREDTADALMIDENASPLTGSIPVNDENTLPLLAEKRLLSSEREDTADALMVDENASPLTGSIPVNDENTSPL
jgi:hypothetical protein